MPFGFDWVIVLGYYFLTHHFFIFHRHIPQTISYANERVKYTQFFAQIYCAFDWAQILMLMWGKTLPLLCHIFCTLRPLISLCNRCHCTMALSLSIFLCLFATRCHCHAAKGQRKCPSYGLGQFQGQEKCATIALEVVVDHNLWFWHASFGFTGTLNDINIWE